MTPGIDWGWIQGNLGMVAALLGQQVALAIPPVIVGIVLAVPLGYLVTRTGRLAGAILGLLGIVYAIPILAMFVLVPALLPIDLASPITVMVALTVYSVIVLVRSVADGLRSVPAPVGDSAAAAGYGHAARLFRIDLPIALPEILTGLRAVTATNVALVTVGALVGAGALGQLFTTGLSSGRLTPVVVGLVLTVVLALLLDGVLLLVQRKVLPWARGGRAA